MEISELNRDRFWTKVEKTSSCWLWTGSRNAYGYGEFWNGGNRALAHRASWFIHHGSLPAGPMCVLHKCDVRTCVNPDHLFLGTRGDNARDMSAKGRSCKGREMPSISGENNPRVKLTSESVRLIRSLGNQGVGAAELSRRFSVTRPAINHILMGRTWRYLDAELTIEQTRK